jgi:GTPase Era involved in 16S rRNA processing
MQEVFNYTQELTNRISPIVESLFKGSSFYMVRLKKQERIEHLVNLFAKFSPEEFRAIPDDELTRRIDKLLVLEAVSGTLNDLTPEQIKIFDEAVEGR